jgi:hypothetical protein
MLVASDESKTSAVSHQSPPSTDSTLGVACSPGMEDYYNTYYTSSSGDDGLVTVCGSSSDTANVQARHDACCP